MWAKARYVALLFLLPAELALAGPVQPGDLFAICLQGKSHAKVSSGEIFCGAGNVPAYYSGNKSKGSGGFALEFQSHPEDGDYHFDLDIQCRASQRDAVTKTMTVTSTTTIQHTVVPSPVTITKKDDPSTSTITMISTFTDCSECSDFRITPRPSPIPSPEPTRFCTTGRPYCWVERDGAQSSADCANGYRMNGCQCSQLFGPDTARPRCNGVATVKCAGCD